VITFDTERAVRRVSRAVLSGFITVLVAELNARATAIADSVERTGTTSDFADANMLRMVASAIDRAWKIYEEFEWRARGAE
jgi:hypothetical protein